MNISIRSFLLLFIFIVINTLAVENQLQKVFYHPGGDIKALELGKVSFYFSQKPDLKEQSKKNNKQQAQLQFHIDQTDINPADYDQVVKESNKIKNQFYTVALDKTNTGLMLTITYNPALVDVTYDTYEAITKQAGLVFTFYNKSAVEQLKNRQDAVLTTVSNTIPTIVIDAGHGGSDTGATGFFGLVEKDLTKSVSDLLANYLEQKGWRVVMTRRSDEFVPLGQRTQRTNTSGADMMISLHANYSANSQASGIETFCMAPALLTLIGSTESNGFSFRKSMSDNYGKLSNLLANKIHSSVLATVHKKKMPVVDRKVKKAVSQVLLGSAIPAVLIELGFISNKEEAGRLSKRTYQQALVEGIYKGIEAYLKAL